MILYNRIASLQIARINSVASLAFRGGLSRLWRLWAAFDFWSDALVFLRAWIIDFPSRWGEFATWFEGMRRNVEPVTWVLGSILALVPGSFAIYKWVYYRYSRLPDRLDDMLEKEEQRLRDARDHLLRALQRPAPTKKFSAPIFVVPSLSRALQRLKWAHWRSGKRLPAADAELGAALSEIEDQEKYWTAKQANYSRQKVTAYLLRGAIAAAHGTKTRVNGIDGEQHNRVALGYFQRALEIDPNDLQALEYAAHQQRILGMLDDALASYQKARDIVQSKTDEESALLYMRAQRFRGEIYWEKYLKTQVMQRLNDARDDLTDALNRMPTIARDDFDHAFILRCLAAVEWKKGIQQCSARLLNAENIFLNLIRRKKRLKEAEAGLVDIQRLRDEIMAAQNALRYDGEDGAAPGLPLDLGAPPNGPH